MVEKEYLINSAVPGNERVGWKAPLLNLLGSNVAISALMVGGQLIAGMPMKELIMVSIVGNVILIIITLIQGNIAAREGLNTYVLAKGTFGEQGGVWVISILLAITSFGWFGVQAGVAGLSIQKIFPGLNLQLVTIVVGLLMMLVAAYGFKIIAIFNFWALPPLFLLMIYGGYKALTIQSGVSIADYQPAPENLMSFLSGVDLVVGLVIVGAILSPDYLRYTRNIKDVVIISVLGIGLISFIQQVAAGAMAIATPNATVDITEIMQNLGMNWIAFLILLLVAWSTNLANAYSAGLALKNVFPNVRRTVLTIVAGVIGTAFAVMGIIEKFTTFLGFLSMTVPAIAGVMWVDYYLLAGKRFIVRPGFNTRAFAAWLLGLAITIVSKNYNFGLPPVNAIMASALIYWLLMMDSRTVVKE